LNRVVTEDKPIHIVGDRPHIQNERSLLQARLQGIYNQADSSLIEKDLIGLAVQWNKLDSTLEVGNGRLQR